MPQPKARDEQGEAGAAAAELVAGEHELGDVGRAGDEHHGAGGQDQRAHERVAQDAEHVGRAAPRLVGRAGGRLRWPRRRVSRRAEAAKVMALSASTSSGAASSRTPAATRGADQLADLAHRAEEAVGGVRRVGVTIDGQQRAGRGAQQRAAEPGGERQRDQRDACRGRRRGRRRRARRSGRRRSRSRAGWCGRSGRRAAGRAASPARGRRSAPRSRPRPSRAARRRAAAARRSRRRCRARSAGGRRRTSARGAPSATGR